MNDDPQALSFAMITPALWEQLVPQARQDKYIQAQWRARVWLRARRRGLLQSSRTHAIK